MYILNTTVFVHSRIRNDRSQKRNASRQQPSKERAHATDLKRSHNEQRISFKSAAP